VPPVPPCAAWRKGFGWGRGRRAACRLRTQGEQRGLGGLLRLTRTAGVLSGGLEHCLPRSHRPASLSPACPALTLDWVAHRGQVPPTTALLPGLTSSGLRIHLHISPPQVRPAHAPRAVCCRRCQCAMRVMTECEVDLLSCAASLCCRGGFHDDERRSMPLRTAQATVRCQRPQVADAALSTGVGSQTVLQLCHCCVGIGLG